MSAPLWWRIYGALASVFALGVAVQVFLAGAAIVHDAGFWNLHVRGGPFLEGAALVLLVVALAARMPARFVVVPVALAFLVMFQYASMSFRPALVAALHPVNALVLFAASAWVARSALDRSSTTDDGGPTGGDLGHLRAVAALSLALGLFGAIGAVYLAVRGADGSQPWIAGIAVAALSVLAVVAAFGLFWRRRWGRVVAYVVAGLALVAFPFGTAFGLYAFVGLRRPGVGPLLR